MSIGTLLAYTIVSASVIILRYKPEHIVKSIKNSDTISLSTASLESDNVHFFHDGKLRPKFWWLSYLIEGRGHNEVISGTVITYISCCVILCLHLQFASTDILDGVWWEVLILICLILCSLACLLVIGAHKQNPPNNLFRVPWVPLIPGLSILCNIGLMVHLNSLTWVRFTVWMILGLLVYFFYGIKHSKESDLASTYSMLITSSEANKEPWGTINTGSDQ